MRFTRMIVIGGIHAHRAARDAIFAISHAGLHAFFGERAVPVILIELAGLRVVRDKNIGPAIAIVIEDNDAERFAGGVAETGLLRYVFEFAAAEIAIQLAGR